MGIFDSLIGGGPQIQNGSRNTASRQNPIQMLMQLKRNPGAILRQSGFNIPSNVHDPGDGSGYMQYLRETGQVDDGMLNIIQSAITRRTNRR